MTRATSRAAAMMASHSIVVRTRFGCLPRWGVAASDGVDGSKAAPGMSSGGGGTSGWTSLDTVGSKVTRRSTLLAAIAAEDSACRLSDQIGVAFDHLCFPAEAEQQPLQPRRLAHPEL